MVEINNRREVNKIHIFKSFLYYCRSVCCRSLGTSCVIIEYVEVMVATWTCSFVLYGLTAIPSLFVTWTALHKTKENSEPYWENYLKFYYDSDYLTGFFFFLIVRKKELVWKVGMRSNWPKTHPPPPLLPLMGRGEEC